LTAWGEAVSVPAAAGMNDMGDAIAGW
jgi:hypothetical protein